MAFEFQGQTYVDCEVDCCTSEEIEFILYLSEDDDEDGISISVDWPDSEEGWLDLSIWPQEMWDAFESHSIAASEVRDEIRHERRQLYGGKY